MKTNSSMRSSRNPSVLGYEPRQLVDRQSIVDAEKCARRIDAGARTVPQFGVRILRTHEHHRARHLRVVDPHRQHRVLLEATAQVQEVTVLPEHVRDFVGHVALVGRRHNHQMPAERVALGECEPLDVEHDAAPPLGAFVGGYLAA